MALPTTDSAEAVRLLFSKRYLSKHATRATLENYLNRKLVCTPFLANYGTVAGWVICVEGSPPKGTLLWFDRGIVFYIAGRKTKAITSDRQLEVINRFYDDHLAGSDSPITIERSSQEKA